MILIADSGSTKTQWILAGRAGLRNEFSTPGINPVLLSDDELRSALCKAVENMGLTNDGIESVCFYGAGCLDSFCPKVASVLREVTGCDEVTVGSDMLGAARAMCGDEAGIVAILGTGSNSCFYNGRDIVANTPPLGYILGDEGSGARIGIRLVNGVLKGYLPAEIRRDFAEKTKLDKASVIERVYRRNGANVFLASLVPFVTDHINEPSIECMVLDEFRLFFERNVIQAYPHGFPVSFVGSIAAVFEKQLHMACSAAGYELGRIAARPLPMLVDYHLSKQ